MKNFAPLYDAITKYAANTESRFHMPGHGGKIDTGFLKDVSKFDVTELRETDNLAFPTGAIKKAEELAAKIFNTSATVFSCAGATLCIQAAIYAAIFIRPIDDKNKFYCHRKVHKSVVNAFALLDIQPVWFCNLEECDFSDCGIMFITSVDYYGNIIDYTSIKNIREKYNIITIADNSHGSHLAFYDNGKFHPSYNGFDFCIDSLHKTLPVLTGGACLHIKDKSYYSLVKGGMSLFGSTSPNYLIMASIDLALSSIDNKIFENTLSAIENFEKENPKYFDYQENCRDPFRIILRCEKPGELYNYLYDNSVKCEFYDDSGVILIPPYGTLERDFSLISMLLSKYDPGEVKDTEQYKYQIKKQKMTIRQATFSRHESIETVDSIGKISACEYSLYPPGIPIIIPGEMFDKDSAEKLKSNFKTVNVVI